MKRFSITKLIILLITATNLLFFTAIKAEVFIEWHEISSEKYFLFDQLKPIFTNAFLPLDKVFFYASKQNLAEKFSFDEQKIEKYLLDALDLEWKHPIEKLPTAPKTYLAIAKDEQENILGFAWLNRIKLKNYFKIVLKNGQQVEIVTDSSTNNNDEIYIKFLAVNPKIQKKGVGKALLFSIFKHLPDIKKLFLITYATDLNKNAKDFYEHVGFTKLLRLSLNDHQSATEHGKDQIIYFFKKD